MDFNVSSYKNTTHIMLCFFKSLPTLVGQWEPIDKNIFLSQYCVKK